MSDHDCNDFVDEASWLAFHFRRLLGESPGTPAWEIVTTEAADALNDWDGRIRSLRDNRTGTP